MGLCHAGKEQGASVVDERTAVAIGDVFGADSDAVRRARTARTHADLFDAVCDASARLTLSVKQARRLIARVFYPFARDATTPEAVESMFRTLHVIVTGDGGTSSRKADRQKLVVSEEFRDRVFFVAVEHAASVGAVRWLCQAMFAAADGQDPSVFATEESRSELFLPLAQHATSPDAVMWVFTAVHTIVVGLAANAPERVAVFASSNDFRDSLMLPLLEQTETEEPAVWGLRAIEELARADTAVLSPAIICQARRLLETLPSVLATGSLQLPLLSVATNVSQAHTQVPPPLPEAPLSNASVTREWYSLFPRDYTFDGDIGAQLLEVVDDLGLSRDVDWRKEIEECRTVAEHRVRDYPRRYGEPCPLNTQQTLAITLYTHDAPAAHGREQLYLIVNKTLRDDQTSTFQPLLPFLFVLCGAIDRLPSMGRITVYRGLSGIGREEIDNTYVPGSTVLWRSFTSLSLSRKVALRFANPRNDGSDGVLFVVDGVNARGLRGLAENAEEQEVVLQANTRFTVTSVARSDDSLEVFLTETSTTPGVISFSVRRDCDST